MNDKIRVLVMDTSDIQTYQSLNDEYDIIHVGNDDKAGMKLIKQHLPNVVMIGSGIYANAFEVARAIKQFFPAIKIIMMSEANDPSWLQNAFMAGADNILAKPMFLTEEVSKTINLVCGKPID
jgi:DNA-binding NarL/FixJ family response regulator